MREFKLPIDIDLNFLRFSIGNLYSLIFTNFGKVILNKFKTRNTQNHLYLNYLARLMFKFRITRQQNFTNEDLNLWVKYLVFTCLRGVRTSQGSHLARIDIISTRVSIRIEKDTMDRDIELRKYMLAILNSQLKAPQNMLSSSLQHSYNIVKGSYSFALLIANKTKPFSNGELVQAIVKKNFPR